MKQWYEELFTNYAESYEKESFTMGTKAEVDFIEHEIAFNKSLKILDIGCGTGRHDIELARRGYNVTGVDLSESMLAKAKEDAAKANVKVKFEQGDARTLPFTEEFDFVMMVCEGSFPLMETDEMNFSILKSACNAVKPGEKFLFTTLNGLFPLFHSVKDFINGESSNGAEVLVNSFDLMTFRDYSDYEIMGDDGVKKILKCNERYYVPSEITWLLKSIGFKNIEILGCAIGEWKRDKKLTIDDYEMLVITQK
jgi:2-polyprenyl-3-methyl-5-hydroxy-6-metoxy-1,4-benzoquinol methylase